MNEPTTVTRRRVTIATLLTVAVLAVLAVVKFSPRSQKQGGLGAGDRQPGLTVVRGPCQLTEGWSVDLPEKFNRRSEDDSIVIWRHGLTLWFSVGDDDRTQSKEERLAGIEGRISANAFGKDEVSDERLTRLCYRLNEGSGDGRLPAFYGFVVGTAGQVQMGAYFDDESAAEIARKVWLSVRESGGVEVRALDTSTRK